MWRLLREYSVNIQQQKTPNFPLIVPNLLQTFRVIPQLIVKYSLNIRQF